jgi:pyrroloquinoline-quinone synthase
VDLVRQRNLVEAVASSLTELFAPELMSERIAAWKRHYPWVTSKSLGYFEARVERAKRDSGDAVGFVVQHASSRELQDACVAALVRKTEVLWHLLDCVAEGPAAERG